MVNDFTEMDFFRGSELIADPYPYYEALRQQCPVTREHHHGVTMVTGWDEACAVLREAVGVFETLRRSGALTQFDSDYPMQSLNHSLALNHCGASRLGG